MTAKSNKTLSQPWFASWFDTPYYHILYKNRNYEEAQFFIDNLVAWLSPNENATMLDLACGRGRHAIYLSQKGFDVTGIDLSEQSINFAKQFENTRLQFFKHDMRQSFEVQRFDYIFNLFTSFGFFESDVEHQKTLNNIAHSLQSNGIFVIDFLNIENIKKQLIPFEIKTIDGIDFRIKKSIKNGFILKKIKFSADGNNWQFEERVRGFSKTEFIKMIENSGLTIQHIFGNYNLEKFDEMTSERMIIVAKKYK